MLNAIQACGSGVAWDRPKICPSFVGRVRVCVSSAVGDGSVGPVITIVRRGRPVRVGKIFELANGGHLKTGQRE